MVVWSVKFLCSHFFYQGKQIRHIQSDMGRMYSVLRYSCTRVQNFRYSYFTRTRVFSRSGTCTHTRTHDQMYSYFSRVSHEYTILYFSLYYQFFSSNMHSWLPMVRSIPIFFIKENILYTLFVCTEGHKYDKGPLILLNVILVLILKYLCMYSDSYSNTLSKCSTCTRTRTHR